MKILKSAFLMAMMTLIAIGSTAQQSSNRSLKKKGRKALQRLHGQNWYAELDENRRKIEGDPSLTGGKGRIYDFLQYVGERPHCISIDRFVAIRERYEGIVSSYNGLIDDLIFKVNSCQSYNDFSKIRVGDLRPRFENLNRQLVTFFVDIEFELQSMDNTCNRQSTLLELGKMAWDNIAIPILNWFEKRSFIAVKRIVTEELENLKLAPPVNWYEIEAIVRNQNALKPHKAPLEYERLFVLNELRALKALELSPMPASCYQESELRTAYEQRKSDITAQQSSFGTEISKEAMALFQEDLDLVEAAYAQLQKKLCSGHNLDLAPQNCRLQELKGEINGILGVEKHMNKQQLINALEDALNGY